MHIAVCISKPALLHHPNLCKNLTFLACILLVPRFLLEWGRAAGRGDAGGAAALPSDQSMVRHPRFNTHFEIVVFWFCIKFYVTSFNVFLSELALSELQSSP